MRVSVYSPHGYLNWDKFLPSNFVMLSMYGLQLTTTKFLIFVYLDHPFILNPNWSNPSYHIVCYTTRQSSVTNVRLFTQQNTYDQYVYASFFHQHTAIQCIKSNAHRRAQILATVKRKRKQNFSWPGTHNNDRPKITSIANCSRENEGHPTSALIHEWLCVIPIFVKTRIKSCQ